MAITWCQNTTLLRPIFVHFVLLWNQVAIIWHQDNKRVSYEFLEQGWSLDDDSLDLSRNALRKRLLELLESDHLLPYKAIMPEFYNEHALVRTDWSSNSKSEFIKFRVRICQIQSQISSNSRLEFVRFSQISSNSKWKLFKFKVRTKYERLCPSCKGCFHLIFSVLPQKTDFAALIVCLIYHQTGTTSASKKGNLKTKQNIHHLR